MQKLQRHYNTKETPQSEKIPGSDQVKNNAGGYSFAMDCWGRLNQFLILGTSGGTYYVKEKKLTIDNAEAVRECIKTDGPRTVQTIVEVSHAGRAPKNDPALFALAMCTKFGDIATRRAAYDALPKVARIGTHLFNFVTYREGFGGWGRGMRSAVAKWYNDKGLGDLAYQIIKYQQRDGWSHRDLMRLSHPKTDETDRNALYSYAVGKEKVNVELPKIIRGFEAGKTAANVKEICYLIHEHGLTREMIPTKFLTDF
jgi:60 kDa SS-A/Ro ribonucleoprotein